MILNLIKTTLEDIHNGKWNTFTIEEMQEKETLIRECYEKEISMIKENQKWQLERDLKTIAGYIESRQVIALERRMDDLGRIVIPRSFRQLLGNGDFNLENIPFDLSIIYDEKTNKFGVQIFKKDE